MYNVMLCASPLKGISSRFCTGWREKEQRAARAAREFRRAFVATTIRSYFDATIAIALTSLFALVVSLIAAVIVAQYFRRNHRLCAYWRNATFSLVARRAQISVTSSGFISSLLMGLIDPSRHGGSRGWGVSRKC
jgi:hypothetical protein